jgi:ATP-binding cassette subfamily B protein
VDPAKHGLPALARTAAVMAWRGGRFTWLGTIGLAVVTGAISPLAAWVLKEIINDLSRPAPPAGLIIMLAVGTVMLGGAGLALTDMSMMVAASCQRNISMAVTSDLYAAVNRVQGLHAFERPGFQDDLRLAEHAADETPAGLSSMLSLALQSGTTIAGYAGILLGTWPPMLGLLAAACVPTIVAQLFLARRGAQTTEAMMRHYREWFLMRGLLSDPKAVMESRVLGLGEYFRTRLIGSLRIATTADYAVKRRIAATQGATILLGSMITAAGAALVAVQAAHHHLGIGNFVMFLAAVGGTQAALLATVNQWSSVGASLRLLSHYVDVLAVPDDLPVPPQAVARPVPTLRRGIELRDVWFRYAEHGDWVLRGVSATLPFGQATALVGVNGSGKSTLIKLLCRLYDPEQGGIFWDGHDLRELDPAELRRRLAVTFQDFLTYDISVAANIGIGDLAALTDRPRIAAAAALADLDRHIAGLPGGYDTILSRAFLDEEGEQGTQFSGGQNQRLVLARTLMREHADLIALDEPSSGLDADAEHRIHQALAGHRRGRTSLLVSHRLSAVRDADRIIVLEAGQITEQGRHDELMRAGGSYARMFTRQADGYRDHRPEPVISHST